MDFILLIVGLSYELTIKNIRSGNQMMDVRTHAFDNKWPVVEMNRTCIVQCDALQDQYL